MVGFPFTLFSSDLRLILRQMAIHPWRPVSLWPVCRCSQGGKLRIWQGIKLSSELVFQYSPQMNLNMQ